MALEIWILDLTAIQISSAVKVFQHQHDILKFDFRWVWRPELRPSRLPDTRGQRGRLLRVENTFKILGRTPWCCHCGWLAARRRSGSHGRLGQASLYLGHTDRSTVASADWSRWGAYSHGSSSNGETCCDVIKGFDVQTVGLQGKHTLSVSVPGPSRHCHFSNLYERGPGENASIFNVLL